MRKSDARKVIRGLAAAALLVGLVSCSGTLLSDVWRDQTYTGGPFHNVAVFVLGSDPAARRLVEDEVVRRLPMNTRGMASYGIVPEAEQGDINKARERIKAGGFDGVVIARLVGVDGQVSWSPGSLQQVPFELLEHPSAAPERLLATHVVSYTPSASILVLLRTRTAPAQSGRFALAVAASPSANAGPNSASGSGASGGAGTNGIYALNAAQLRPLPLAVEEVEAVRTAFGARQSELLVRDAATEMAFKAQPLSDYRVLHLAAHGIMSTKVPARSALVLRPSETEDGLLQAREILNLRLNATLVTLSACDTSTGAAQGQDGVASLVRPFVAAGARAVVANLWAADDTFNAAMMREFYRHLARGQDIGESLRQAKLRMIETFGPEAVPRLWSGVLVHGDAAAAVIPNGTAGQTGGSR